MRKKNKDKIQFFALAGSICRRQFVGPGVTVGALDVKSLIEHDGEC